MATLEQRIQAKVPGPDTGIKIKKTVCDICAPDHHCGIDALRWRARLSIRTATAISAPRVCAAGNMSTGRTAFALL